MAAGSERVEKSRTMYIELPVGIAKFVMTLLRRLEDWHEHRQRGANRSNVPRCDAPNIVWLEDFSPPVQAAIVRSASEPPNVLGFDRRRNR